MTRITLLLIAALALSTPALADPGAGGSNNGGGGQHGDFGGGHIPGYHGGNVPAPGPKKPLSQDTKNLANDFLAARGMSCGGYCGAGIH